MRGVATIAAFALLLVPSAEACSVPPPTTSDFDLAVWTDEGLETNLNETRIRIDLATGAWEPIGPYLAWGAEKLPHDVEKNGTTLVYHAGNVCCLCGPYTSGFHVESDGRTVASWGQADDPRSYPLEGINVATTERHIVVVDAQEEAVTWIPFAAPSQQRTYRITTDVAYGVPSLHPAGEVVFAGVDGNPDILRLHPDGADALTPPEGAPHLQQVLPTRPATLVGRAWIARDGETHLLDLYAPGTSLTATLHGDDVLVRNETHILRFPELSPPLLTVENGSISAWAGFEDQRVVLVRDAETKQAQRIAILSENGTRWFEKDFHDATATWQEPAATEPDEDVAPRTASPEPDGPTMPLSLIVPLAAAMLVAAWRTRR